LATEKQFEYVACLMPHNRSCAPAEREAWQRLLQSPVSSGHRQSAAILGLVAGLRDSHSPDLIRETFEDVHGLLERDSIVLWQWRQIEAHVPVLLLWDNWDKCRRLRRAVGERFVRHRWSFGTLFGSIKSKKLRKEMRKTIKLEVMGGYTALNNSASDSDDD
jgi:CelD/BcsL family acetyltransferase involved in cellulose biosynthesis